MLRNNGRHNFRSPLIAQGPQPSLVLDFAGTGTLDSRVTFTRSTTGRYYDSSTVALAEQNLFLQSNTFSNAAWVKTGGTVATGVTDPNGGTTASSFTASSLNATLYQTVTLTATPYTESIYIQRVSGVGVINLTLDGVTLSPVTITGSWVKYTYTATPSAGSQTVGIQVVTIGDVINIYGSQIENRSPATATNITTTAILQNYIPQLMTAAIDVARFDYNPTTRVALGLLIEQSSTNTWLNSSTFGGWVTDGAVTLLAQNIFIDGTQTLNILGQGTGNNRLYQFDNSGTLGSKTFSFYAKQYTGQTVTFSAVGGTSATGTLTFNLNTGTASGGTGYTTSMTLVGNGVYRCSLTISVTAASGNSTYFIMTVPTNQIFIGGFQYEALAFPTSYIPTTSAQVTRAADTPPLPISTWYNTSQGTWFAQVNMLSTAGTPRIVGATPSSKAPILISSQAAAMFDSTTTIATANTITANTTQKIATAWTGTTGLVCLNGGTVASGSQSTGYADLSTIGIGYNSTSNNNFINGRIAKITYYPQALTSVQLQTLTGP
jgi:hypothetical protein